MLVKLESVGSVLDTKELLVYAMNEDNTIDIDCCNELSECDDEWREALSLEDSIIVFCSEGGR
jgi:hypothetical protein